MTTSEAVGLMTILVAAFPRPEISEATAETYLRVLLPVDYAQARVAIDRLILTQKFLPAISEIREAVTAQVTREFPTSGDAWALAMTWVRKIGGYGSPPQTTAVERLVVRAINGIGGWAYLCHDSDNLVADRARFFDGWDELVRRERTRTAHSVWPLPAPAHRDAIEDNSVRELVSSVTAGMESRP